MRPEPQPSGATDPDDQPPVSPSPLTPAGQLTPEPNETAPGPLDEAIRRGREAFERGETPGRIEIIVLSRRA